MNPKNLLFLRSFMASVIFLAAIQIYGLRGYIDNFFTMRKTFSLRLFFSERYELEDLLRGVIVDGVLLLREAKPKIKILFLPLDKTISSEKICTRFNEDEPSIAFLYTEAGLDNVRSRIYATLVINENFAKTDLKQGIEGTGFFKETTFTAYRDDFLKAANSRTQSDYEAIVQGMAASKYTLEEIQVLSSAAAVNAILRCYAKGCIVPGSRESDPDIIYARHILAEPLYAYGDVFFREHPYAGWKYLVTRKCLLFLYASLIAFLVFQSIRAECFLLLADEFAKKRIPFRWPDLWRFGIKNWKLVLFASKEAVMEAAKGEAGIQEEAIKLSRLREKSEDTLEKCLESLGESLSLEEAGILRDSNGRRPVYAKEFQGAERGFPKAH